MKKYLSIGRHGSDKDKNQLSCDSLVLGYLSGIEMRKDFGPTIFFSSSLQRARELSRARMFGTGIIPEETKKCFVKPYSEHWKGYYEYSGKRFSVFNVGYKLDESRGSNLAWNSIDCALAGIAMIERCSEPVDFNHINIVTHQEILTFLGLYHLLIHQYIVIEGDTWDEVLSQLGYDNCQKRFFGYGENSVFLSHEGRIRLKEAAIRDERKFRENACFGDLLKVAEKRSEAFWKEWLDTPDEQRAYLLADAEEIIIKAVDAHYKENFA